MYISEAFQKQGLGTRFLEYIEPVLNEAPAYCMPLAHVTDFYKKVGFIEVPENTYPDFLVRRCQKYREAGYIITTMYREKSA